MGFFSRKSKYPDFNALVEGTTHDDPRKSYLKLITLPEEIGSEVRTVIDDKNVYSFYFPGSSPKPLVLMGEGLECRVGSLSFLPGLIVGQEGYFLEQPRALILPEGRVFIEDSVRHNSFLLDLVAKLNDLRGYFHDAHLKKEYQHYQVRLHS